MTIDELLSRMRTPGCSEPDCGACESNRIRAQAAIDDISRAAKLSVLLELEGVANMHPTTDGYRVMFERVQQMIASLETEAAEPAKEEKTNDR